MQPLIGLDQFLNTLIWIAGDGVGWRCFGWADETLSARLFRCHLQGLLSDSWYRAVDALFCWQDHHCYTAWRSEVERRHLPGHYSVGTSPAG